ncbi:hypothetical protein D3C87_588260 [compost metagenome]
MANNPDHIEMVTTYVDPPSGWQFGFPKVYDFKPSGNKEAFEQEQTEWFVTNGYPLEMIKQGMLKYCRYWSKETNINLGNSDA